MVTQEDVFASLFIAILIVADFGIAYLQINGRVKSANITIKNLHVHIFYNAR